MDIDYKEKIEGLENEILYAKEEINNLREIDYKLKDIEQFLINYTRGNYERYLKNKKE